MQFETGFDTAGDQSTVFVIETEQVVRSALDYILSDRYRTFAFATLGDALAAADAPDAVLLGISILQSEPDAAFGRLLATTKVLLVADRGSDPIAQAMLERGVHGIVSKPISFDSVRDAVGRVLAAPAFVGEPSRLIRVAFG